MRIAAETKIDPLLREYSFLLDELLQQTSTASGSAASSALQERLRFDLETISDVEKHY